MEQLYKNQCTLIQMREGVLGAYVDALSKQLSDEGYAKTSVRNALQLLADLGRWLSLRRMTPSQLTPECLRRYLKYRSNHGHRRSTDAATLQRLSNLLLAKGVIAPCMQSEPTPVQQLEEEFRHYLELERGLATATVQIYQPFVSRFLAECFADGRLRLDSLCATDVVRFVQREAARLNHPKRAKLMTTALRAFLQYARYRDLIDTDLRLSVPTVASWTMASLPRALSSEDVQHLLNHCDRQTAIASVGWVEQRDTHRFPRWVSFVNPSYTLTSGIAPPPRHRTASRAPRRCRRAAVPECVCRIFPANHRHRRCRYAPPRPLPHAEQPRPPRTGGSRKCRKGWAQALLTANAD